ncbi:hypothetical protein EZV62_000298 [Acer yangbiense]|uniref:RING-type domain-containing protein n=1 Tax=Acer yangbiense TaxID=1000413 RepID=A0A5C7IRK8_9ROSI|nr:hypothetical protein EZV62_000298 [Acer yangbiense]
MSDSAERYSICLEEVSSTRGRTVVTLRCSHMFHLDCIGSYFNVDGIMQCPANCRRIENGQWLFSDSREQEPIPEIFVYALNLPVHYDALPMTNYILVPQVAEQDYLQYMDPYSWDEQN